jgi:hypothetical protein
MGCKIYPNRQAVFLPSNWKVKQRNKSKIKTNEIRQKKVASLKNKKRVKRGSYKSTQKVNNKSLITAINSM